MQTKIGIVYEITTGKLRRFIVPDHDYQLDVHSKVLYDEKFIIEFHIGTPTIDWINSVIRLRTGRM